MASFHRASEPSAEEILQARAYRVAASRLQARKPRFARARPAKRAWQQDCDDDGDAGEYDGGADDHDGWGSDGSEPGWARQPAHSDGDDKVLRQEQIELAVPAASMAIDAAAVSRAAGRPPGRPEGSWPCSRTGPGSKIRGGASIASMQQVWGGGLPAGRTQKSGILGAAKLGMARGADVLLHNVQVAAGNATMRCQLRCQQSSACYTSCYYSKGQVHVD